MATLLLLLLIGAALLSAAYALLHWTLTDAGEEQATSAPKPLIVTFFDAPVWNRFSRWGRNRPPQLSYRRDRRGRFRKLS